MKCNWRLLLVCLGLLWVVLGNRCPSVRAADALPAPLPLTVPDSNSKVTIVFCYCPPGELSPGRPKVELKKDDAKIVVEPMAEFWIGQTEVTFAQYQALMGPKALSSLIDRLNAQRAEMTKEDDPHLVTILDNLVKRLKTQQELGDKANEPVFAVTIEEVAAFCNEVNKRLTTERDEYERKQNWVALMEKRSVRLPTSWEWQYACGAARTMLEAQASPHFPQHLAKKRVEYNSLKEGFRIHCVPLWNAAKLPGENTEADWAKLPAAQFQERLLAVAVADLKPTPNDSDPADRLHKVLAQLAKDCYGWPDQATVDGYSYAGDAGLYSANAWGIRGMLDNVTEWVLWQEKHVDPMKNIDAMFTWKMLMATPPTEASRMLRAAPRLFLAGGSWTDGYQGTSFLQRTVWGGPVLDHGKPSGLPYLVEKKDGAKNLLLNAPGFRLVLQRRLIDNWLVQTQRAWIDKPEKEALEQLGKARKAIERLVAESDKRGKYIAILDYHEVQAKNSDPAKAIENLVKNQVIDENDKLFLELTGK